MVISLACSWGLIPVALKAEDYSIEKQSAIGLTVGLAGDPEASAYRMSMVPVGLFCDWEFQFIDGMAMRTGYTLTRARLDFRAYETDWRYILTTQSLYLGYRLSTQIPEPGEGFLFFGLAYLWSDLQINSGGVTNRQKAVVNRDEGFGIIGGAGVDYKIGHQRLGLQLEFLSRQATLDGVDTATGHLVMAMAIRYPF